MITLLSDRSGRRFGQGDLDLVMDLARHAALAVDNARLYQQRSLVASTLQRSLLPPQLPAVAGVELAARYRASGAGLEVGGDFYDAFAIDEESFGIAIGDVCGKGPEAAAVTGLTRHAIRASALYERSPARTLSILNGAVLAEYEGRTFCTVAYGVLELRGNAGASLRLSLGGHPLPLHLRSDGCVEAVGTFGTLIGVFEDPEFEEVVVELSPGDALLAYTDGLVEGLEERLGAGEQRLVELLQGCVGSAAEEIAATVEGAVAEAGSAADRDDIAFLVVRVTPA